MQTASGTYPDLYLQQSAVTLICDHRSQSAQLIIHEQAQPFLDWTQQAILNRLRDPKNWPQTEWKMDLGSALLLECSDTREHFIEKVKRAKDYILDGEIYQVNLSQQFRYQSTLDPFILFQRLQALNPNPFSAYLQLPFGSIISGSPERFLRKQGRRLETRPIKGTAPRKTCPEADQTSRVQLIQSAKEQAELLMITDLMRNDLSRVSTAGSVRVQELQRCEEYTNVFHLLSIIQSTVKPDLHPVDVIRACFPGGSITGCPKLRAMEVIEELEKRPRGIYTGCIGYLNGNGDFDWNLAIRTLTYQQGIVDVQLGGGIVADSDPQLEYEETLHKGAGIRAALGCNA